MLVPVAAGCPATAHLPREVTVRLWTEDLPAVYRWLVDQGCRVTEGVWQDREPAVRIGTTDPDDHRVVIEQLT